MDDLQLCENPYKFPPVAEILTVGVEGPKMARRPLICQLREEEEEFINLQYF